MAVADHLARAGAIAIPLGTIMLDLKGQWLNGALPEWFQGDLRGGWQKHALEDT